MANSPKPKDRFAITGICKRKLDQKECFKRN